MYLTTGTQYDHGIYCSTGSTEQMAQTALYKCRNGDSLNINPRHDTPHLGWAVTFGNFSFGMNFNNLYDSIALFSTKPYFCD